MNETLVLKKLGEIEAIAQELRGLIAAPAATIQVPRQGPWRRDMLEELWPQVRHLKGVVSLFALTAANAPDAVTYHEVLEASGLSDRQQGNEHARLSRVTRELFGRKTWPIQNWQDHRDGVMRYRMGATVADWWHTLAEKDGSA